jgi:hypothetical protein
VHLGADLGGLKIRVSVVHHDMADDAPSLVLTVYRNQSTLTVTRIHGWMQH